MKGFQDWEGRLLLCRHGQAIGNIGMTFMGSRDDELTDLGHRQAQNLAALLAGESIDKIISSPLRRAADTAAAVAKLKGLEVEQDARLKEMDFGRWEGLSLEQVRCTFPENYAAWQTDGWSHGPEDGETLGQVTARVVSLYESLFPVRGTVALVAHAGCLQALICHLLGITTRATWPFRLANGSVTEIQYIRGFATVTRLSATS